MVSYSATISKPWKIRAILMFISTPRLILVDPKRELCQCWKQQFRGLSHVEIVNGRFEELEEFDCMVSAANSFGLIDGGVDLAIICYFGVELMDRVQEKIIRDYLGEQPVGTSVIVETGNAKHPFIAHTPTMRVPMTIASTDYVFAAMWAMLVAVHQHNRQAERKISSIACPGPRYFLRNGRAGGGCSADGPCLPLVPRTTCVD